MRFVVVRTFKKNGSAAIAIDAVPSIFGYSEELEQRFGPGTRGVTSEKSNGIPAVGDEGAGDGKSLGSRRSDHEDLRGGV